MKVIDGKFKKEKTMPSDVLQSGADVASDLEDQGVEFDVVVTVQMKGTPSIIMSNITEVQHIRSILDFAIDDLKLCIWNEHYTTEEDLEDDPSVH